MTTTITDNPARMQCMEVWGGNTAIDRHVTTPGLESWLHDRPYKRAEGGGDIYFVSSCASGRIIRLLAVGGRQWPRDAGGFPDAAISGFDAAKRQRHQPDGRRSRTESTVCCCERERQLRDSPGVYFFRAQPIASVLQCRTPDSPDLPGCPERVAFRLGVC